MTDRNLLNAISREGVQSEPFDIDQAVNDAMAGLTMDDLLSRVSQPAPSVQPDQTRPVRGGRPNDGPSSDSGESRIRRGIIAAIRGGNVFVELGGKSQGVCPLEQFAPADINLPEQSVQIGQEHEFVYAGYNAAEGLVLLSLRGSVNHGGWDDLHPGDVVEGQVTGANKGGLEIKINNLRGFMPAGQVDLKFTPDLAIFVGERLKCEVVEVDRIDKRLIVSRRNIVEAELAVKRAELWSRLATGQIVSGTVTRIMPFGAFVDLGGAEGLIHVSAMSHGRVTDPGKIVKVGDTVQVMISSLDPEKQRIALDLRYRIADPWEEVPNRYSTGSTVDGVVTRVVDFGAFVELEPGVEGLVHISELSNRRVGRAREAVAPGDRIRARVLTVDRDKKRISLSISQASAPVAVPAAASVAGVPADAFKSEVPSGPAAKGASAQQQRPLKGGL